MAVVVMASVEDDASDDFADFVAHGGKRDAFFKFSKLTDRTKMEHLVVYAKMREAKLRKRIAKHDELVDKLLDAPCETRSAEAIVPKTAAISSKEA